LTSRRGSPTLCVSLTSTKTVAFAVAPCMSSTITLNVRFPSVNAILVVAGDWFGISLTKPI
jgi:hypothetical protein